jgi:hypothetical protein
MHGIPPKNDSDPAGNFDTGSARFIRTRQCGYYEDSDAQVKHKKTVLPLIIRPSAQAVSGIAMNRSSESSAWQGVGFHPAVGGR